MNDKALEKKAREWVAGVAEHECGAHIGSPCPTCDYRIPRLLRLLREVAREHHDPEGCSECYALGLSASAAISYGAYIAANERVEAEALIETQIADARNDAIVRARAAGRCVELQERAEKAEAKLAAHLATHRTADAHDCAEMEEAYQRERAESGRLRQLLLDDAKASHWNESGLCGSCTQRSHSLAGVSFPCEPYREAVAAVAAADGREKEA